MLSPHGLSHDPIKPSGSDDAAEIIQGGNNPGFKERDEREHLSINPDPAFHYHIRRSRHDGLEDIVQLAKSGRNIEEAWLFVESKDPEGKREDWFEIGENENGKEVHIPLDTLASILKDKGMERAAIYHLHPAPEEGQQAGPNHDSVSQMDIISHYAGLGFLRQNGIRAPVSFGVATSKGILAWSYDERRVLSDNELDDIWSMIISLRVDLLKEGANDGKEIARRYQETLRPYGIRFSLEAP